MSLLQPYEVVSDTVFRAISDTKTPQGILCLMRMPHYEPEELIEGERTHLLILESIQDPGKSGDNAAHRGGRGYYRSDHEPDNRGSISSKDDPFHDGKYLPRTFFCDGQFE